MSPQHKALLTAAFDVLGPERVTRGLTSTGHGWRNCFLVVAISREPDALARELQTHWRKHRFLGTLFGVRVEAVNEVVRAWDHDEKEFRALATEWLELNRAAGTSAPAVGMTAS